MPRGDGPPPANASEGGSSSQVHSAEPSQQAPSVPEVSGQHQEGPGTAGEMEEGGERGPGGARPEQAHAPGDQPMQPEEDEGAEDSEMTPQPRVADMPLEEKTKALRLFLDNLWTNCKEGEYLDAIDTVSKWCLAQATARDDSAVRCHFDGWSSKWDLNYRWTSYKIAPFRRYSRGYTGQVKTPLRQGMTFEAEVYRAEREHLDNLVAQDFRGMPAYGLTQYLRGKLFVCVDFVLSGSTYSESDCAEINEFLKAVIRLVVAWLKKAPSLLQKCLADLRRDPELFLVDEDAALLQCACELMGLLQRLFCGCHRSLRYYAYCDQNQEVFKEPVTRDLPGVDFHQRRTPSSQDLDVDSLRDRITCRAPDLVYGQALNFLNYFAELGGFTSLLQLLREGNERPPDEQEESKEGKQDKAEKELMPLEFLGDLTGAFANCGALMSEEFARRFVDEVQEIITNRLMGMKDKEIKELDKDGLPAVLQSFRAFLQIAKGDDEISELVEQIQLSFAARFLKTTYLEKRLKGVTDIRQLIERVGARDSIEAQRRKIGESGSSIARPMTYVIGAGGLKIRPTQFLETATLRDWLVKEKVAEILFGEGAHPEILKRAAPVLRFLSHEGALTQDIVDLVWKCQQGKHEETVRVVYGLINDVVEDLPPPLLEALFKKIAEVPESQYSEMYLLFLKEFSLRALEAADRATLQAKRPEQASIPRSTAFEQNEDIPASTSGLESRELRVFSDLGKALTQPESTSLSEGEQLYGLPVMWNIMQDSYQSGAELTGSEILRVALDSMCEILTQPFARPARMFYLIACLNNLKEGNSLYPSICIAISILEGLDASHDDDADSLTTRKAIDLLEKQLGLVSIILNDITHYDSQVKEALKQLVRKNKSSPERVESHVFAGRTEHQLTLEKLLELMEFVVLSSNWSVTIRAENLDTLWRTFVLSPNFTSDQTLFLQFINKKRHRSAKYLTEANSYSKTAQEVYLFTASEQKHLFTQILCNPTFVDYSQLSAGLSKCFHTYFRLINKEEGFLEQARKKVEVSNFEQLIGIDSLWRISFDSENEKAREESRELLVDLHLRLGSSYQPAAKRGIMQSFIDRSMSILLEASQAEQGTSSERKALNVIQVLAEFLDRYEGKKPVKPELKSAAMQYQHFQPWTITVICRKDARGGQQEGRIQVSQFETLGSVREKCAQQFGLELNEFQLRLKHGLVDPDEDDDRYVKDHGMSPQIYLLPNQAYDKQGHPKYLVAQNQQYFELLFALLAKSSASLVEPVWELLQKLPVNAKLHQDISQLQGTQEGWNSLLDSRSTHKLLYSLKIIEGLNAKASQEGEKQTDKAAKQQPHESVPQNDHSVWKRKFVERGGFRHLLDTLAGLEIEAIDSKLTLRCIESLLGTILEFMQVDPALHEQILAMQDRVVLTCLRYLHLIGLFTLQVERQRGEAVEDIQAKRTQKRLAKQKMKQLQMAGAGNDGRRRAGAAGNEEDSDGEEDESSEQINQVLHEFAAVRSVVDQLFSFMNKFVFEREKSALAIIGQYSGLEDLVKVTMLQSENYLVRGEAGRRIREMITACSGEPALNATMTALLHVLLIKVLPATHEYERRSAQYFGHVQRILEELNVTDLAPLEQDLWQLALRLAAGISTRETQETDTKQEDRVLVGMMTVLRGLLQKYPARKAEIGARLVSHLLSDCLFQIPHGSGAGSSALSKPKCKSMASRGGALRLLAVLSRDCLDNLSMVLDYIKDFGRRASWRTNKTSDWSITHLDDEKSSTGYVGLKNLGCICYMISLFQQLFMVPGFRSDILAVEDPNHDNLEPDENMFYQLQALLSGLLKSEKQYVNPKGFCHAFKDWEGQPTNVLEQMDVEEFLQMFLDRLETAIKGTPKEKTVQSHFGGKFASEMICKGCPHYYERSEPFLSIGVPVKNKRSIQEGLNAFIQGDMLEGDNAYLCAKCDKKVDTLKRTCVKELPRYLIITLKRFEFDFDRMVRVKVNDYCEFPLELDMLPYTQEGLARRESAAKRKQEAAERGEEVPEEEEAEPLKHPRDYYEFKLKGVIVHTGTADSGHYYSFIRESQTQDGERWYEFNDHIVRDFDLSELANECFGGEDSFAGQGMMQMRSQKWRNAYLVIYERKNQSEMQQEEEEVVASGSAKRAAASSLNEQVESMVDEESSSGQAPKLNDPEHPIQQKILLENQKYWQNKFLFGAEYFEFLSEVTHFWDTANIVPLSVVNRNNDPHIVGFKFRPGAAGADPTALQGDITRPADEVYDLRAQHADSPQRVADASHEVFKLAAGFYLTILQRAQNKALVPKMLNALKSYLNYDQRNGEWLIRELSNWDIVEEMLLQLHGQEMPKLTCGLIYCAMLTIYEQEKASLADFWRGSDKQSRKQTKGGQRKLGTLGNFILLLLSRIYDLKAFTLNLPHYFQILARFASLGPEAREFLLNAKIVGRCMDFFFDGASPYRSIFSDMTDLGAIWTREQPDIGLPTTLNQKVRNYFQALQEKRRCQQLANAPAKYKYLMELVSTCVRHMKVLGPNRQTPYQLDADYPGSITTFVSSQEADIFIPEAKFLKKFLVEAKRNRSMNAVAKAHCHYAVQDADQVEELYKTVEAGLHDQDFDGIRPFLCLFEVLLETKHEHFTSRRASWLARFIEAVKSNSGYFKWMETVFEFIFKIVGRNAAVREWFYNNPAAWQCLGEWVRQHPRAPHPAQTGNSGVRLFKGRQNMQLAALQQHNDPASAARNSLAAAYRVRKLQEMLSQAVPDASDEPDTDKIDLQDFKFVPGDVLTLYERKRDEAEQWRVVTVLDEMVSLHCLSPDQAAKGQVRWQKCDTDKLLLGDTYRQLSRTRLRQGLLEQRQAQQAARAQGGTGRADADEDMQDDRQGARPHQRASGQGGQGGARDGQNASSMNPDLSSNEYDSSEDEHGGDLDP